MPKAARDRIKYPQGPGFPRIRWAYASADSELRAQPLVENLLGELGILADTIESIDRREVSHIHWDGLKLTHIGAVVDFIVAQANSVSAAYSEAVARRFAEQPNARMDLTASLELVNTNELIRRMFSTKRNISEQVIQQLFKDTRSLQDFIDLVEQNCSEVVSSYEALGTGIGNQNATSNGLAPRPSLDAGDSQSRRSSWWEKFKEKIAS